MGFVGIGAIAMTIFTWMKSRFLWWPLHPIGFPIMATRVTDQIWFSVMLAWLIKVLVLKYGGTPLFLRNRRSSRPTPSPQHLSRGTARSRGPLVTPVMPRVKGLGRSEVFMITPIADTIA